MSGREIGKVWRKNGDGIGGVRGILATSPVIMHEGPPPDRVLAALGQLDWGAPDTYPDLCPRCKGSGDGLGWRLAACDRCGGTGLAP